MSFLGESGQRFNDEEIEVERLLKVKQVFKNQATGLRRLGHSNEAAKKRQQIREIKALLNDYDPDGCLRKKRQPYGECYYVFMSQLIDSAILRCMNLEPPPMDLYDTVLAKALFDHRDLSELRHLKACFIGRLAKFRQARNETIINQLENQKLHIH